MKLKSWALLIVALTLYYLAVTYKTGFFSDPEALLIRMADDSAEYIEVANWLFGGEPTLMIERRSFLYPLVLGMARWPFGNLGIWLLQMSFWLISAVIFFVNARSLIHSPFWRWSLLILFCLAWTPILLTLTALTESLTLILFSLAGLLLVYGATVNWSSRTIYSGVLIVAGLLAAVKPNYAPMFYGILLTMFYAHLKGRLGFSQSGWVGFCLVAALPTLIQMALHHQATGSTATSNIGHHVVQVSLYSQVQARWQKRSFMPVREEVIAQNPGLPVMVEFLAAHPWLTLTSILHNLEENLRTVLHITAPEDPIEHFWRKKLNDVFFWIHIIFIFPLIWVFFSLWKLSEPKDINLILLAVFFFAGILPTGISFWAADRWTAPLITLWPLIYILVAQKISQARALRASVKALPG